MRSGAKYEVKLLEITDHELRFKMFNNPEGPLYSISRNSFQSIRYANGVFEELALKAPEEAGTMAVNGYNVSVPGVTSEKGSETAAITAEPSTSPPQEPTIVREKRSNLGHILETIVVTGLVALDIAADVKAATHCARVRARGAGN